MAAILLSFQTKGPKEKKNSLKGQLKCRHHRLVEGAWPSHFGPCAPSPCCFLPRVKPHCGQHSVGMLTSEWSASELALAVEENIDELETAELSNLHIILCRFSTLYVHLSGSVTEFRLESLLPHVI